MAEKLLVVIQGQTPTTEIVLGALRCLEGHYSIKIVSVFQLELKDLYAGEFKLLFLRLCDPSLHPLLKLLNQRHIQYLYYIDDNFWELRGDTPVGHCYQNPQVQRFLTCVVKQAHCVIASTKNLALYVKQFNPAVVQIDGAFDFNLIRPLKKNPSVPTTETVKIVYSSSYYRDHDFACLIDALSRISREYQHKVSIHFNGYIPTSLTSLANVFCDPTFYPYKKHIEKQFQENYDIGLAPLADTASSRAKSNVKYREYSATGIAGIYTNIAPYNECITDGQNGLLTEQTSEAWYQAIKRLIEDPRLRQSIARTAFLDVKNHFSNEKIAPQWLQCLQKIPANATQKIPLRDKLYYHTFSHLYPLRYPFSRVYSYWRHHGLAFTFQKIVERLRP